MAVVAYINDINPKHGVLADCTVKLDDKYKLQVQLIKHKTSGKYRILSADLDRSKFVALGYDFDDLKERITDAVVAKYERRLHSEHARQRSPKSAAYENTLQMEVDRMKRERQQYYKDKILTLYRIRTDVAKQ